MSQQIEKVVSKDNAEARFVDAFADLLHAHGGWVTDKAQADLYERAVLRYEATRPPTPEGQA